MVIDTGGEVAVVTIVAGGSHRRPCCCWYWWGWAWLGWPSTRVGVWVQCTGVRAYVQGGMVWGRASVDTGERAGVNADECAGRDGVRVGGFDLPFCRRCPPRPFLSSPSFMDQPRPRRGGRVVAIAGVVLVRHRLPAVLVISVVTVDGDTY